MTQICDGTIPWDGGTQRLPRIVGRAWATDMLLSGRVMDSEEALRIGLAHQALPSGDLASRLRQMASTMAALAPIATRYAKETVLKGMDMTLEQGMRLEMDLNLILQTTRDRAEGIASFLEKRHAYLHRGVTPEPSHLRRRNQYGNIQHELPPTLRSGDAGGFPFLLQAAVGQQWGARSRPLLCLT